MILKEFLDDVLDNVFIRLKFNEGEFSSAYLFRKYRVNRSSKLLDCKVQSIGLGYIGDQIVIDVYIECKDLNDIRYFFK